MAFGRKDIKKSSYYVWFLGAKEAEGLRGDEFILPVLRYLIDQEGLSEVSKVTLQVSNKGLKIIQNVPKKSSSSSSSSSSTNSSSSTSAKLNLISSSSSTTNSGKTEQIKHLIPHNAITCVVQEEDLVACILLIYNPITKCPVHVHAYRCDSIETAKSLRGQLQLLIDKPENQRKFREIESRLVSKGLTVNPHQFQHPPPMHPHPHPQPTSESLGLIRKPIPLAKRSSLESRSTRTESSSDRTEDSYEACLMKEGKPLPIELTLGNPKVAILYESLAAELKAKLSNPKMGPILLPPKDYDTISRKQGKLTGIDLRKSTNLSIVGPLESSPSSTASSSSKLLSGVKGLVSKKATPTATPMVTNSSLSTSSSSSSSLVIKKSLPHPSNNNNTSTHSNPVNHCIRSESSCKSSSGIGSDEPDQLSSISTSPFNNGSSSGLMGKTKSVTKLTATTVNPTTHYRGDISSDDSERNWSPIESGPSLTGIAKSTGSSRLLTTTAITGSNKLSTSTNNNNHDNQSQNKLMMVTNNPNNSKNIHRSHNHSPGTASTANKNMINNSNHKASEKLESNRLNSGHHHYQHHHHHLSSSSPSSTLSSSPSSSSLSGSNRVSIPPPVVPKTATPTPIVPIKTDLRRGKNDLRPVITGVTPHSASLIKELSTKLPSLPVKINSSVTINNNNNINHDNHFTNNNHIKSKTDPPRYYFPDQIVTTTNHFNGQIKNPSSSENHNHPYGHPNHRRSTTTKTTSNGTTNYSHDYVTSESVKSTPANPPITIINPCARLKPTSARDFIRVQPLTNYQRSPISY